MSNYDFAVIGGGSAGYAAARTAASLGLKTVVIEGGEDVGGLCILRGCMPSKTLIESANRFRVLKDAREFGLYANDIGYDSAAIIRRKHRLIGEFADYRREQLETGKFDFIRGQARFTDKHTLDITLLDDTTKTITSRAFLISTGSSIKFPDVPGLAEADAYTSDDILELEKLPSSIVVLGAGPVGLELAHYLSSLGVEVTIVQRGEHLLKGVDPDVAEVVEQALRKRGVKIHTQTKIRRIERDGDIRRVVFEGGGQELTVEAPALLNALGRKPNTASLDLDKTAVERDGLRIVTNLHQQTKDAHIFAAGDCTGPYEIVHIAVEQGEIAARNAHRVLEGKSDLESIDYRLKLYAVFTEPQIGTVGLNEAEAREKGHEILTASYPFNDHGKSLVMHELDGFVKMIVDKTTREILGATVVGPHASDLIHEVVVAMRFHATAGQFAKIPHYHPTLSEIWTYPAEELAE